MANVLDTSPEICQSLDELAAGPRPVPRDFRDKPVAMDDARENT